MRDVQLCPGALKSLLIRLFTTSWILLPLGKEGRTGTVHSPGPSLICGGCGWQVQAAVVQWAPESYLVSADF